MRIGKVTEFNAKKMQARVKFTDMGIISHWLPLLVSNSINTKDTHYLDEGEHVACLMQGTGAETGYVLGAIYDDKNYPEIPGQDPDIRRVKYDDGTEILYDRKEHKLMIDVKGDVEITASGHMKFSAERIDLN